MATRAKSAPRKSAKRVASKSVRRKHVPKRPPGKKRPPSSVNAAAPEQPLAQRVMEAAAQVADDYVERSGEHMFGLSVHGVLLTVVVEERRQVARIIAPLFPESAYAGDLLAATNEMNSRHIAYGYTYVRDGEVRYAVEVLLAPFRAEVVGRALQVAAAVVRGLGMEVDEETRRWVGVGE